MRQTTTPRERMHEVLDALGISANEFEVRCGLGSGFVARITSKTRQKIKEAFPDINMDYVSMGRGKPFDPEPEPLPTLKDRIAQFCKALELTEKEFCRKAGLSSSFVANMSDNIRRSSLELIIQTYPMLNTEWLMFGTGKMLDRKKETITTKGTTAERIKEIIRYLGVTNSLFERETGISSSENITQKQVDKITSRYPHINPLWLMYGHGEMMNTIPKDLKMLPLVSQRVYKRYAKNTTEEFLATLPTIPSLDGQVAFEVAGDAMDDGSYYAYMNGDIVICEEAHELPISSSDFVIVHKDGVMVRRIKSCDKEFVLHALNKGYPDVRIPQKDVRKAFVITKKISSQKR